MIRKNKRGISPLIATVLIIGFTIVLAALVITWGTNLFKTTVEQTETESKFSLACTTGLKLDVVNRMLSSDGTTFDLTLRNNNQDRSISNFTVVLNFDSGESEIGQITSDTPDDIELKFPVPKRYMVKLVPGSTITDLRTLEDVDLYPIFVIEGDERACENSIDIKVT